jgi:Fe-S-cluster containining protein
MSAYRIVRPVWRQFRSRWLPRAAAYVRRGGHAVVEREDGDLELLLGVDEEGKITELGYWSLLAIEQQRWRRVKDGPAAGLATARVRDDYAGSVLDWCDRDSVHKGPTRTIRLDCLECGACCHEANVLLDDEDLGRWREAGRKDLLARSYLKREDGKVFLRFLANGRCQNLKRDNKCAIYPIRPDNCAAFVVGSEACLAAREDTLELRDGFAPED